MKQVFVFEPNKYYRHSGGGMLHTLHYLKTFMYGIALIAEDRMGKLHPVGSYPENAINYHEITEQEFKEGKESLGSSQRLEYELYGEPKNDSA
jgi:hypothetical protein